MIAFDTAHAAVHYPRDRRLRIWIRPSILVTICIVVLLATAASWLQLAFAGLPYIPPVPQVDPNNFAGPHGFPPWVLACPIFCTSG